MARLAAWSFVFLACFALQVPWVQCVADCHEDVHPDVKLGDCHPAGCEATDADTPSDQDDSSHGDAGHLALSLATVESQQSGIDAPDLTLCHDSARLSAGPDAEFGVSPASRRTVEPEAPARLSAVLLL